VLKQQFVLKIFNFLKDIILIKELLLHLLLLLLKLNHVYNLIKLNLIYLAIYAKAKAADSFTSGSNSSKQKTSAFNAPLFTT
jgi:hypothetical protein